MIIRQILIWALFVVAAWHGFRGRCLRGGQTDQRENLA